MPYVYRGPDNPRVWVPLIPTMSRGPRRGIAGFFAPDCKAGIFGQCTPQETAQWCATASAASPLSYVLCLPQDVQKEAGNVVYGPVSKAGTLAPGSASPGLPVGYDPSTGTVDPSNTTGATQYNPYSLDIPPDVGNDSGFSIPSWVWIGGAAVIGLAVVAGKRSRR